jgi:uncharacterized OB-fold protein
VNTQKKLRHGYGENMKMVNGDWIAHDDDKTSLMISVCQQCAARWFPPRDVCSTCASHELEQTTTGDRGTTYASTVVRVGAAPFRAPYVLSYIDIDGVRVLTHVHGDRAPTPDTPVWLTIGPIGYEGETELWSYVAQPTKEEGTR